MDDRTDFSQRTLERIMAEVVNRKEELLQEWSSYHEKD